MTDNHGRSDVGGDGEMYRIVQNDCLSSNYVRAGKKQVSTTLVTVLGEESLHLRDCPDISPGEALMITLPLPHLPLPVIIRGRIARLDQFGDGAWVQFSKGDVNNYMGYRRFVAGSPETLDARSLGTCG
ncbi:MAG: hypothetical protein HYU64_12240 [Armatimonadetes bacterium]|nr:hypothetical protein [Armatimonadota bacterium]